MEAAQLRRWDDRAKTAGVPTEEFEHYIPMIRRVLAQQ